MKGIRYTLALMLSVVPIWAAGQKIDVSVESVVAVGETFRLEYRSTQQMHDFTEPQFGDLEVLAGPTTARFGSTRVVNGSMVQEVVYACTYVLRAPAEGTYTISEASADLDGKRVTARAVTITAMNEKGSAGGQTQTGSSGQQGSTQTPRLADDDVIIRAIVDKTNLYKGEALRVTFKLYTRADIRSEGARMPAFNGFWAQQLESQPQQQREALNGKIYTSQVLREYLLFPQQTGKLTIEPLQLDVVAQFVVKRPSSGDPFEDMMMGGGEVKEVRRKVSSAAVVINANPLPSGAPESFNGAVGEFTMTADPLPENIVANSAINRIIKIAGNGNLAQVQAPAMKLPESFEQYSIKTTESISTTSHGVLGSRQFEYPFIARAEGEYVIPAVEFSYFNPRQVKYVTLRVAQASITILPDTVAGRSTSAGIVGVLSKEDVRLLGRDIRFIKLGTAGLHRTGRGIVGNGLYLMFVLLMGAATAVLYFYLKQVMRQRRNSDIVKGKYANRVALRRFRQAEAYMNDGNQRGFYEEMLKGLWGYMADKLNIPVANLTKESIREGLQRRGVGAELAESYVAVIGECEYAQYAPSASGRMSEEYARGVEAISELEGRL